MLIKTKSFHLAINTKGDPASRKLALILPGKLDTKDYVHMLSHVNFLSGLGFLAVSFDPPGTWESPGGIELYTTTNYIRAINELIEYFGNKSTFIMGHSRGGSMAIYTGIANPKITSFAAIMSYVYKANIKSRDEDEFEKKGYVESMRDLPLGGGPKLKQFRLPLNFLQDQKKYSDMALKLKTSAKPKLFVLGKKDVLVPAEAVRKAHQMASDPKQLYELDSFHDYRFNPELIGEVNKVVGDFLREYSQI